MKWLLNPSLWCIAGLAGMGAVAMSAAAQKSSDKSVQTSPEQTVFVKEDQSDPHEEAIVAQAKAFMDAFNRHDAKRIAELFTRQAELQERDGEIVRGRKAIEEMYTQTFKTNPQARISLSVDSVRQVSPTVSIEEGRVVSFPDGKSAAFESRYQAVHTRTAQGWFVAHVRTLSSAALSHHEHLKDLEWMIGHWIDEADNSVTQTTCQWSDDKNFLLRKFTVKLEGQPVMNGVQRIGWDPLTKQFKSWVFDSEGGYAEGLWSRVGDNWVVKARGVRQDGTVVTSTNQFTYLGKDRMQWVSVHRMAGNEQLPDVNVTAVRKPPMPKQR